MVAVRESEKIKYCNYLGVFSKTIIPLVLAGYEILIANSRLVGYLPSRIQRAVME